MQSLRHPTHRRAARRYPASPRPRAPRSDFIEIPEAAFFVGRLNKNKNREEVYSALRRLADKFGFYIKRLDMPYLDKINKIGNHGYCFVHTRSPAEAQKMIHQRQVQLMGQRCEIKPYGVKPEQRESNASDFNFKSFAESMCGDTMSEMSYDQTSGYETPARQQRDSLSSNRVEEDLRKVLQTSKFGGNQWRTRTPAFDSSDNQAHRDHSVTSPLPTKTENVNQMQLKTQEPMQSAQIIQSQPAILRQNTVKENPNKMPLPSSSFKGAPILRHYIGTLYQRALKNGTSEQFVSDFVQAYQSAVTKINAMDGDQIVACASRYQEVASLAMNSLVSG